MGRFKRQRLTAEQRAERRVKRYDIKRQVKGIYVHNDKLHGPYARTGMELMQRLYNLLENNDQILVAAVERDAIYFEEGGHDVLWHTEQIVSPEDIMLGRVARAPDMQGPLSKYELETPVDAIYVSERLEKQLNLHEYLVSLRMMLKLNGWAAFNVALAHHEMIDYNVNLFTEGQLLYNLVMAGWNCRDAVVIKDFRFISVLVRRLDVPHQLDGTINSLSPYMPYKKVFQYCSSELGNTE